jgi:hypothetical protein
MRDQIDANVGKFQDTDRTAEGEPRARVRLTRPKTLWFNTGTLCNIECVNCYIESSPTNDALVYISADEVKEYLDQLEDRGWPVTEIGFTGGEPFLNPEMIDMAHAALERGYEVLILTNAMRPMMRRKVQNGLLSLDQAFPGKITLRVSLDHHAPGPHDAERGVGAFDKTVAGMMWLRDNGLRMTVAGRSIMADSDGESRAGYAAFFASNGFDIDAQNPLETVLFPEMDIRVEVPEITTACWGELGKLPDSLMCASSRMVVKRKGASRPAVLACTLLPYAPEFELGETLAQAERDIALNHPHCAALPEASMYREFAGHVLPFAGADHLAMHEPDRMQRPFDLRLPELDKLEEPGMVGGHVVLLPDVTVQHALEIRHAIEKLRRGQTVSLEHQFHFRLAHISPRYFFHKPSMPWFFYFSMKTACYHYIRVAAKDPETQGLHLICSLC